MFNDEENIRKQAFPENDGKFCIRECAREFIPLDENKNKVKIK